VPAGGADRCEHGLTARCLALDWSRMERRTVDVVVVGAGPTGLLLASELMLGGVRVVLVERRTEVDLALKAGGIGALAGEVLERRGLGPAGCARCRAGSAPPDAFLAWGGRTRGSSFPLMTRLRAPRYRSQRCGL
jgi:2-polyprenyl-6-methoxyphenol hydroxylase-like FAD-dependent oxidoreductase